MGLIRKIIQAGRHWRIRAHHGVTIGTGGDLGPGVVVEPGAGRITIGNDCSLATGVVFSSFGGHIELARWVFVGPYTTIYGHAGVSIGEGTLIAMHCRILSSNHTIPPFGTPIRSQPDVLLRMESLYARCRTDSPLYPLPGLSKEKE